ncbi:neuropeptide Y receptor type 5 [Striga asiatica]|uniref:Neuropeptide Y receptor type 5 n=1 Tax=Striga asiatica TaxID=4170 RepID=A0A5A7PHH9_STRAF|nr:neuropeptide Y receptor type 5 [Striga asiatica]
MAVYTCFLCLYSVLWEGKLEEAAKTNMNLDPSNLSPLATSTPASWILHRFWLGEYIRKASAESVVILAAVEGDDQYHHSFLKCSLLMASSNLTKARQARLLSSLVLDILKASCGRAASISSRLTLRDLKISHALPTNGLNEDSQIMLLFDIWISVLLSFNVPHLGLSTFVPSSAKLLLFSAPLDNLLSFVATTTLGSLLELICCLVFESGDKSLEPASFSLVGPNVNAGSLK